MKRRNGRKEYICNCCAGNANDDSMRSTFMSLFQNEADFSYRRVYNVTVCDALKISEEDPTGRRKIIFDLEYNLFKLLHIALLSNTYAAYRIKELNKVKQLLEFQGELPHMYLKNNMTSNPILIKYTVLVFFTLNGLILPFLFGYLKWNFLEKMAIKKLDELQDRRKEKVLEFQKEFQSIERQIETNG